MQYIKYHIDQKCKKHFVLLFKSQIFKFGQRKRANVVTITDIVASYDLDILCITKTHDSPFDSDSFL